MALFTDPGVITLDDLLQFESTLVQVSSTHAIDVPTKIKIAMDGIGDKLVLALLRAGYFDRQMTPQTEAALSSVLVTPALYRWLCFDALARIFAEAYNFQLNTRFQGKLNEYQKEATEASILVYASGLGMVMSPLSRPSLPAITVSAGTFTPSAIFVQTTWVNSAGRESAPSLVNGSVLNGFSSVQVAMDSASAVPPTAVGWNVYMSLTQQGVMLQNSQPVGIGQPWSIPNTGLISGATPSGGQVADRFVTLSGRSQRG